MLLPEEWNDGGDEFERKYDELNLSDDEMEKIEDEMNEELGDQGDDCYAIDVENDEPSPIEEQLADDTDQVLKSFLEEANQFYVNRFGLVTFDVDVEDGNLVTTNVKLFPKYSLI